MIRGAIWWAELPDPLAAEPGYRRPVLLIQSDAFTRSRIHTVIAVVITTNLRLATAPGNVRLTASESGLAQDSVVNVSQIITVDKTFLIEKCGQVRERTMRAIEAGVRLVLSL
ncbi:MAG: type II toxin-antitoxin system PemK/MazF family toxin [Candidatus Tectimicrobiota bacterium]